MKERKEELLENDGEKNGRERGRDMHCVDVLLKRRPTSLLVSLPPYN